MDAEPLKGALLQLKEQDEVNGELPNASKGLSFPRVALSVRNRLYPMFGSVSTPSNDYDSPGEIQAVNKEHAGMMVYNTYESALGETNPDLIFRKGFYAWTGDRWENLQIEATNALLLSNGTIRLGGALTQSQTTISVNAASQDLKIDVANNSTNATHGFFIDGLETQANSRAVVADVNTGKLGVAPVIPAMMAFFQSGTETGSIGTSINTGNPYVVPWEAADQITNNLVNFDSTEDSFELNEDGIVEISGMVNYRGGVGTSNTTIVINATLQLKKFNTSTWMDFSSVRGVYVGEVNAYRNTLNIPPALVQGQTGDKIRLILRRPPNSPSGYLGSDHTNDADAGIVVPYGTQFSKSIKIVAL
ncbi:MAG: hypothetical protein LBS05_05350 [Tannerellaceae bacterium]|nr:hypothetical protein [Tannerellaceae bacterium]